MPSRSMSIAERIQTYGSNSNERNIKYERKIVFNGMGFMAPREALGLKQTYPPVRDVGWGCFFGYFWVGVGG